MASRLNAELGEGVDPPMLSTAYQLSLNLAAAAIGWLARIGYVMLRRQWQRRQRIRAFYDFFGTSGRLVVIHSAVLDQPSAGAVATAVDHPVYNYPGTDIRASRLLVRLFESVGMKEGNDGFTIKPDIQVKTDSNLWDKDLVLLCGPARNHIFHDLCPIIKMRYTMEDNEEGSNVLKDTLRGHQQLLASRELPPSTSDGNFDYGLLASLPNPNNHSRRIVILAGIHGTGTVGAAEFLTTGRELQSLVKRRQNQVISEVVQAFYDGDIETPTKTRLV
jgi:hypothetical protein